MSGGYVTTLGAVMGGVAAAASAAVGMTFLRGALAVRTVPERVMEWVLIFIPIEFFGYVIQRFGFDAKRYALYGSTVGMLVVLAMLGALALRGRWSVGAIFVLALALWLFVMVVIMPLTDAGFFAVDLVDGTAAAIIGHLAVALSYATMLIYARTALGSVSRGWRSSGASGARVQPRAQSEQARDPLVTRRSALIMTGGVLAAYVGTFVADRWAPRVRYAAVRVVDPQVPFPSGGIDPPQPHPNPVHTPGPLNRQLVRDKDGALLAAGRRRGELAPLITANQDFYIVTKNAVSDPFLDVDKWWLVIDGEVERPIELDYQSLRRLPTVELTRTLECISNFVSQCDLVPFGCDLISTARWRGARVSDVLEMAGLKPGVISLAVLCADEYVTALPIQAAFDPETLLVYEMNGETLPREHGYPIRLLVPGRYGMKNAKWVRALRPLRREFLDWYGQRNWSRDGVVKTMTRIDVPASGATLDPGEHRIAGIAYASDRGIQRVEYSVDGGAVWQVAELIEPQPGRDAWVRWQGRFTLSPGSALTILARATDGAGEVQTETFSLPEPNGGTGWHTCEIRASST
jgi:DMSO/TMAO reductase YedYZ molybdopterin-dependent catalytic subunit